MQLTPDVTHGSGAPQRSSGGAAFQLKGSVASLTVLRLLSPDLGQVDRQLRQQVTQLPQFFFNAPVIVDFEALGAQSSEIALDELVQLLRRHKLVPVAARHLDTARMKDAAAVGLGTLHEGAARPRKLAAHTNAPTSGLGPRIETSAPSCAAADRRDTSTEFGDDMTPVFRRPRSRANSGEHVKEPARIKRPQPGTRMMRVRSDASLSPPLADPTAQRVVFPRHIEPSLTDDNADPTQPNKSAARAMRLDHILSSLRDFGGLSPALRGLRSRRVARALVAGSVAGAAVLVVGQAFLDHRDRAKNAAHQGEVSDPAAMEHAPAARGTPGARRRTPSNPIEGPIVVQVIPAHATVTIDGQPAGNPHQLDVRREGGQAQLIASAPGYQTRQITILLSESSRWVLALDRASPPKAFPEDEHVPLEHAAPVEGPEPLVTGRQLDRAQRKTQRAAKGLRADQMLENPY